MQVNPSINIAIGKYGKSCNDSFHNHFKERELDLNSYASFYGLTREENCIMHTAVDNNSFTKSVEINNTFNLNETFNNNESQYFLKEFVNSIYNNQINLLDQLNSEVNFQIVNINLILSSFEELNAELVENLVSNINELCNEGMISNIVVKAFIILSKDGVLLNKEEEITAYHTLDRIKIVQQNNNRIFSNIIFIDDKNTSAVYLKINPKSIGLVLNEFVTYLMTNHYNMVGNLMNSDYLSLGIGMIYFDESYFKKFFRSKIFDEKIDREQLSPKEHLITTSHYINIRDKYFYPVINKSEIINISTLTEELKTLSLNKNCTLESYKFLLSHLVGDFKAVRLKKPLLHIEKISIKDTLYQLIKNSFPNIGNIDILDYKKLLDDIDEMRDQLKDLKEQNEENMFDERIKEIQQCLIENTLEAEVHKKQINKTLYEFQKEDNQQLRKKLFNLKIAEIENLQGNREDLKNHFKEKFCLKRLFHTAEYRQKIEEIDKGIQKIKDDQIKDDETLNRMSSEIIPLLETVIELEKKYDHLNKSIDGLQKIKATYNNDYKNAELFNYLFINHIVKKDLLKKYLNRNIDQLLLGLNCSFEKLTAEPPFSLKNFLGYHEMQLNKIVDDIIDFNMVDYLLKKYDNLDLLKETNTRKDIADLIKISVPFFNADNAFVTNNSHSLILYRNHNEIDTKNLREELGNVFHVVPQQIQTLNANKFSLIKIDVIPDFTSLVKYNMGKKRHEKDKIETK